MRIHTLIALMLTSLCFVFSSCKEEKKEHEILPELLKHDFDTTLTGLNQQHIGHYFQYPDIQLLDSGKYKLTDKYNQTNKSKHIYLFKWYDPHTTKDKVGYIWVTY